MEEKRITGFTLAKDKEMFPRPIGEREEFVSKRSELTNSGEGLKECKAVNLPSPNGLCRVETSGGRFDERFFLAKALLEPLEKGVRSTEGVISEEQRSGGQEDRPIKVAKLVGTPSPDGLCRAKRLSIVLREVFLGKSEACAIEKGRDGMIFAENNENPQNPQNDTALSPYSPIALSPSNNKKLDCFAYARNDKSCAKHTVKNLFAYSPIRLFTFKKVAFTLAEVLITLGVIGVIAAITLPPLVTNLNERINSERQANIAQKITQAMEQMRAHGQLNTPYASTDAFVDQLQNYLKIAKRCDSSHIADCWPTASVIGNDDKIYTVSDSTTRKKLHLGDDEENSNVGLVLADGSSLIMTYNPNAGTLDIGDKVSADKKDLPVGNGKTKEFPYTSSVTGSIDFVMDVNGKKGPNKETTADKVGDIRSFKAARFGADCPSVTLNGKIKGMCVVNLGTTYTCISEEPYTDNNNCWAGAKKACSDIGMTLASLSDHTTIYNAKGTVSGVPTTGWFWSSTELNIGGAYFTNFSNDEKSFKVKKDKFGALCVGN